MHKLTIRIPVLNLLKTRCLSALASVTASLLLVCTSPAQPPPAPSPDVLIFTNGEKLIGHLERSSGESVTFKSDMAGEVTVDWSKIQELHSAQTFGVIGKGVTLSRHADESQIPQGTVSMADQKIQLTPANQAASETIPVANTGYLVGKATLDKDILHNPGFFHAWKGAINAGASLVEATQNSRTFTGGVNLVRLVPSEDWIDPRNKTLIDYNQAYGTVTQPGTPTVKTNIFHADAERDEYLSSRLYGFGALAFDHNYSQGLDLQQTYGGGLGYSILRNSYQDLDVKASVDYIRQAFVDSSLNKNLIGSVFGERYDRKLPHKIFLVETLEITPAWNDLSAYSAIGGLNLTLPLYKRLNISLGAIDNYLNNPPPGFKRNSFQFIAGFAYTLP